MTDAEKAAKAVQDSIDALKTQIGEAATKEDFSGVSTSLDTLTEKLEKFDPETIKTLEEEVLELKESLKEKKDNTVETFAEEVVSKMDDIQAVLKGKKENVVIKANVTRASITNNTQSLHLPDIGQLGVRERSLYNILPKIPVSQGNHRGVVTYTDWDEASIVRAANVIAEGGTFPESTAVFREYNETLRKIGDTLPVTEEFGEDQVTAAAELEMFLRVNVGTVIDNQLVTGSGTGQNLNGLLTRVNAYAAPDESIQDANIYDLIKRVRTSITATRGSKYSPDFCLMNSNTMDQFNLEKDGDNNYLFLNIDNVGSIAIIEDNYMPDNQLIVGDRRYAKIYEMGGVELSEGLKGDQFVQDLKTLKARKRMLLLVRAADLTGFAKVTNITTALASLTA